MASPKSKAEGLHEQLKSEAEAAGYLLNPDKEFVMDLMEGLVINRGRYGYLACPCRDADGVREKDLDIICPCDYRDPDLNDFGACYCALYVSEAVAKGEQKLTKIDERRPLEAERGARESTTEAPREQRSLQGKIPVWRCTVCGYLCAREEAPLKCPICKVDKDRFERFG